MSYIVFRGFDDDMTKQRAVKSTEVLLTAQEPRWKVVVAADGEEYRAFVSCIGVGRRGNDQVVICEASGVVELKNLQETKNQLDRRRRERPVLQFGEWPEPPPELQALPALSSEAAAKMPRPWSSGGES